MSSGVEFLTFHALQLSLKSDGSYYMQEIHGSIQLQPCSYPPYFPPAPPTLQGRGDSATSTNESHCLLVQSIDRGLVPITLSASVSWSFRSPR